MNRQLRPPVSFRGHLTPLSRRSYQPENRFSSCPALFSMSSGRQARFTGLAPASADTDSTNLQRSACAGELSSGFEDNNMPTQTNFDGWEALESRGKGGQFSVPGRLRPSPLFPLIA